MVFTSSNVVIKAEVSFKKCHRSICCNFLSQVDVQVRANCEMTEQEKNVFTAVVLAESAAKLAQSAATYEEVSEGLSKLWVGSYPHSNG